MAWWVGVAVWRAEADASISRLDLQHLIEQLHSWFEGGMFRRQQPAPGVFLAKRQVSAAMTKEQKWGKYRDDVMRRIGVVEGKGWATAYTDGLAKQVFVCVWGGGMVWYGMPYGIGSGWRAAPSRSPCLGPGSGASLP